MDTEEILPKKKITHEIGCELDTFSIEDLNARITILKTEIKRLKYSIEYKKTSRSDADAVFRK